MAEVQIVWANYMISWADHRRECVGRSHMQKKLDSGTGELAVDGKLLHIALS